MIYAPGNCSRVSTLVGAFLDGELSHTDRLLVVRHCDTCPRCHAELEAARNIKVGLNRLAEVECDELVLHRLRARVADDSRATVRQYATVGVLAAVAATAAALVIGGFFAPPRSTTHSSEMASTNFSPEQIYVGDPYAPPTHLAPVSMRK